MDAFKISLFRRALGTLLAEGISRGAMGLAKRLGCDLKHATRIWKEFEVHGIVWRKNTRSKWNVVGGERAAGVLKHWFDGGVGPRFSLPKGGSLIC